MSLFSRPTKPLAWAPLLLAVVLVFLSGLAPGLSWGEDQASSAEEQPLAAEEAPDDAEPAPSLAPRGWYPVSYTHLTLPTKA